MLGALGSKAARHIDFVGFTSSVNVLRSKVQWCCRAVKTLTTGQMTALGV